MEEHYYSIYNVMAVMTDKDYVQLFAYLLEVWHQKNINEPYMLNL